jgi:hypothetical protein
MCRKYEILKKKFYSRKEEFLEHKDEYEKIKLINSDLKKLIINVIKNKDEK